MENEQPDKSSDEPNPKRQKMESEGSTSSKPEAVDPFLTLPSDILVKIIGYIPVAQWPSLESLDENFRAATLIAYRQLRNINVERDFLIKNENEDDWSSFAKCIELMLQKFVERSPFLTSMGGFHLRANAVPLLAQFEHLQSISLGDATFFTRQRGIQLENVVEFFESTRSRTSLKELQLFNVVRRANPVPVRNRFATSFVNGRESQSPLKLEKFIFESTDHSLRIRLNTLDTSRLTDVRLGKACVEPQQLIDLIERASGLRHIELSFFSCYNSCNGQRLEANKKLLTAIASRENLTTIRLGFGNDGKCMNFGRELIEMLKTIGSRGQLRKLAIDNYFTHSLLTILDEICATIRTHIPNLQSIKLNTGHISDGSIFNIASLPELEEIDINYYRISLLTANTIKKITQLPHLKRLALHSFSAGGDDPNMFTYLANATTLTDLRIGYAKVITADVWKKWSDGIAANLECFMVDRVENEDENGLIMFLEKAVRLRFLIVLGRITDQSLKAIAKSCPNLETLGVQSHSYRGTAVRGLQDVLDHCPKLNRFGGFEIGKKELRLPKYRKIVHDVDVDFWNYNFDEVYE